MGRSARYAGQDGATTCMWPRLGNMKQLLGGVGAGTRNDRSRGKARVGDGDTYTVTYSVPGVVHLTTLLFDNTIEVYLADLEWLQSGLYLQQSVHLDHDIPSSHVSMKRRECLVRVKNVR
ncbi:hypothetical protein H257_02451 [Aphanomyces astaci]|uniref:Uncharacterized protein n=1 Tax=Aphanomyces astaci TaxID=112090 RepID=W4H1Z3_APHAT|nr:hypothetical protein H257_02451 [Aphanomyces astaci]ETV85927.1 hypothetical protein H257_02451 [Aphanomyces astaci]|eukprot:XP_009824399.1 hypothetical protein H257_02451 [Aphanomyces astaci]